MSFLDSVSNAVFLGWPLAVLLLSQPWQTISWAWRGGPEIMPLVEASEHRRTARGALAPPMRATAQDLLRCRLRLDRHFSFSVSGYLMWLGHISPPNSLFVLHPPLFSCPLHQPPTVSSLLLAVCKLGFDKHDELGIFGRLQRAGLESGMFPATPASSGRASVTLPWGGDVPAGKPGKPRGLENSKLSQA